MQSKCVSLTEVVSLISVVYVSLIGVEHPTNATETMKIYFFILLNYNANIGKLFILKK